MLRTPDNKARNQLTRIVKAIKQINMELVEAINHIHEVNIQIEDKYMQTKEDICTKYFKLCNKKNEQNIKGNGLSNIWSHKIDHISFGVHKPLRVDILCNDFFFLPQTI
jgi:DNA polymerase elongation subunit (family B)